MSVIYVNTDNGNFQNKVYNGTLAKGDAAAVEKKMQEVVIKVIGKNPGFTTNKMPNPKGYPIRLKLASIAVRRRPEKAAATESGHDK